MAQPRRPLLQRLTLENRKPLLLKLSALASLGMLAFAGLVHLPLPYLIGLLIFAADLQLLALRVRLEMPSVTDAAHEEAVMMRKMYQEMVLNKQLNTKEADKPVQIKGLSRKKEEEPAEAVLV